MPGLARVADRCLAALDRVTPRGQRTVLPGFLAGEVRIAPHDPSMACAVYP
jgi:hypothetical protein